MECYAERNKILSELGFASYAAYLDSDLWRHIRSRAFASLGKDCYRCGEPAVCLHHASYAREVLLGETLDKFIPVCGNCHHNAEYDADGRKRTLEQANNYLGYYRRTKKVKTSGTKTKKAKQRVQQITHLRSVSIQHEGQPCPACGTPLTKKIPHTKHHRGQRYAFHWYLYCKSCRKQYMVEEAKYALDPNAVREPKKHTGPAWCKCGNHKKKKKPMCARCEREQAELVEETRPSDVYDDSMDRQHLRSIAQEHLSLVAAS